MFHHLHVFRWVYDKLVKATRDPVVLTACLSTWKPGWDWKTIIISSWDRPKHERCELLVFTEGYDSKETDAFWMRWIRHDMVSPWFRFFSRHKNIKNGWIVQCFGLLFFCFGNCRDINFSPPVSKRRILSKTGARAEEKVVQPASPSKETTPMRRNKKRALNEDSPAAPEDKRSKNKASKQEKQNDLKNLQIELGTKGLTHNEIFQKRHYDSKIPPPRGHWQDFFKYIAEGKPFTCPVCRELHMEFVIGHTPVADPIPDEDSEPEEKPSKTKENPEEKPKKVSKWFSWTSAHLILTGDALATLSVHDGPRADRFIMKWNGTPTYGLIKGNWDYGLLLGGSSQLVSG